MVKVFIDGELVGLARALCDTGSQANLVKRCLIKYFDSKTIRVIGSVVGIGENPVRIRKAITVKVQPWFSDGDENKLNVNMLVLPKSSSWSPIYPDQNVPCGMIPGVLKPNLADPLFWKLNGVSMLLGIEFWATIIDVQAYKIGRSALLQESLLGNLVMGRIASDDAIEQCEIEQKVSVHATSFNELEKIMKRFWEFEDLNLCTTKTDEDDLVEYLFRQSHSRDETGRHTVSILIKPGVQSIGSSRSIALRRFFGQEKRFEREPEFG